MSLRGELIRERELHGFISIGALQRLVTDAAVQECLLQAKIQLEPSLVSRIVSHCPKLFAILVLLELEHSITRHFIQSTSDRIFPVTEVPAIVSEQHRDDFIRTQWDIPPKFDTKGHLELPQGTKLPFLRHGCQRNGAAGIVNKVTVAEGHLAGWPQVSSEKSNLKFLQLKYAGFANRRKDN